MPLVPRDRKPSKADTLRAAARYIQLLRGVLQDTGGCQVRGGHPKTRTSGPEPPSDVDVALGGAELDFLA